MPEGTCIPTLRIGAEVQYRGLVFRYGVSALSCPFFTATFFLVLGLDVEACSGHSGVCSGACVWNEVFEWS